MIKNRPIRLGIGLPHYGGSMVTASVDMWMSMGMALATTKRFDLCWRTRLDVCGIEHARNQLMAAALAAGVDWLLMVDADTWVDDASDVLQAISDADKVDANVMAVATPQRALGDEQPHLMVYQGEDTRSPVTLAVLEKMTQQGEPFCEIDSAATSLIAFDLNFVRDKGLAPPWFRFEWKYGTLDYVSEDRSFCRRVREAGGTIVTPTGFVAKHRVRPKEI